MACGGCAAARAARAAKAAAEAGTQTPPRRQAQPQANQLGQQQSPPRGVTQQFALDLPGGSSLPFGSKLEADAENVRRGYVGRVRPV